MKNSTYWTERKELKYYKVVQELAGKHCPSGHSILDVGSANCEYISRFTGFQKKTRIDIRPTPALPGLETIQIDFMQYIPQQRFDLVLCLQVLEHLADPARFCSKLLAMGEKVIISVPYKWPKGITKSHIQDPVDETKLETWLGTKWVDSAMVRDRNQNRLVVVI